MERRLQCFWKPSPRSAGTLTYKTTSGGKTVMETMFAGTPGEMVTMYYLEGAELMLVHYCSAGNQPRIKLKTPEIRASCHVVASVERT